jgi:anaerobic ribonucleoside-triphosphate reductase
MATMTIDRLHTLFEEQPQQNRLVWEGVCNDCRSDVTVTASAETDGIHIHGGSVYEPENNRFLLKCERCFATDPALRNFQSCEVYSRVVGYLRPVAQWNDGKQAEFGDRRVFKPTHP